MRKKYYNDVLMRRLFLLFQHFGGIKLKTNMESTYVYCIIYEQQNL